MGLEALLAFQQFPESVRGFDANIRGRNTKQIVKDPAIASNLDIGI